MSRFSSRSRRATTALPGYDNLGYEDFGHPASGPQPELDEYGIDSDFGEGVHEGPYRSGPPPASYGWEPDHPAVSDSLVEDFGLRQAMERKAAKCIRIAEAQLGRRASQNDIEELALRFMDLPNNQINGKLASMSMSEDHESGYMGESHESDWHMADDMDEIIDDLDIMGEDLESSFMAEDMTANRWASRSRNPLSRVNGMNRGASSDRLAELLAEQVESLKMANARLASQVRKLADDAVAKGTGLSEDEEELMEDSVKKQASWAPRQQSRGIGRLASVLSEILSEEESAEEESAEESVLASILAEVEDKKASFYRGATEEEAEEEASEDTMGLDATKEASIDPKLARIFEASEEEAEEEESDEIQMSAEEEPVSKKAHARPRIATRQPAVKTLGNISREASSASDDLSKLWDTAPDVSKYFN